MQFRNAMFKCDFLKKFVLTMEGGLKVLSKILARISKNDKCLIWQKVNCSVIKITKPCQKVKAIHERTREFWKNN